MHWPVAHDPPNLLESAFVVRESSVRTDWLVAAEAQVWDAAPTTEARQELAPVRLQTRPSRYPDLFVEPPYFADVRVIWIESVPGVVHQQHCRE